jgi:type I restriction enzyme S subunit
MVSKNDVLICKINPRINRVWVVSRHTENIQIASTEWIVVRNNVINSKYLMWYFTSNIFREYILSNVSGVGGSLMRAQPKYVKEYPIPIPPLSEQQRIVDRIQSIFEKLDQAKGLLQDTLDSFENRKAAILHKAFSGELTKSWRVENRVGMESWEERRLGELLKPMITKKPDKQREYFSYIDIDAIDNNTQKVKETKKILALEAPSRASKGIETGNIIFSLVRPYLKNIAYISDDLSDCIVSTGFYVCRCKDIINSMFLFYILANQETIDYYTSFMKGDNSPSIRKDDFEGLIINLPSIIEQREIVSIINRLLENEQFAKSRCNLLEDIDFIKKAVLAKAFRGELGTNDPKEKSAIESPKKVLSESAGESR